MIVTFYSFKGGVGRSFCLVETAAQLAAMGRSVVVWDLDLEAPGLQRMPALAPVEKALKLGTLDLLLEFQLSGFGTYPEENLRKAIVPLDLPPALREAGGTLSFLFPGQLADRYAEKFAAVRWDELFRSPDRIGQAFFHRVAHSLVHDIGFDTLLIDSRSGYTDLGAICTLQLPDLVVLVFNLNEQNVAGIELVHHAVVQAPARQEGNLPVLLVANMVPDKPRGLRDRKLAALAEKGMTPCAVVPLRPELLLTDSIPTLARAALSVLDEGEGDALLKDAARDLAPIAEEIVSRSSVLEERQRQADDQRLSRAKATGDPEELEYLRRRGIYEKAKTFEERVAELYGLLGYQTTVDYKRDDQQFDLRLEAHFGGLPVHVLVECKDTDRSVTQQAVREFASKVDYATRVDRCQYQSVLIARSGFANNAHTVAENLRVHLQTYDQLLLSLVDLRPNLEAVIRGFQGTALERLYVEPQVVLEKDIRKDHVLEPRDLAETVREWLKREDSTFFALLGDFGCGKTSFSKRLACEMALAAKEKPSEARTPILLDLKEGRSTTVTLESLLTHHFQRLSPQPFNPQALLHLNREGHLLLLFDGFDETIAYTEPAFYLENLRQVLRAAEGKAKVLLTCRTHYFRDRPEALRQMGVVPQVVSTEGATRLYEEVRERPGTEIGYFLEFDEPRVEQYLRKALPPPADWQAFQAQIQATYNLPDLAKRPFLLEIIVKTLPTLSGRGEVTIADLYETYCESWFSREDFRLTLTRERKVALVEYLARLVWDSPENRVHYDLLFEKATAFYQDRALSFHDKERLDYEVRTALFLHRDAEGYYSFIHRSFLEFFVARTLRQGLRRGDPGCLDLKRITREIVFFLEFWPEAEKIPGVAGEVLSASYRPRVSENALFLLYFHARAQLGPLIGPDSAEDLQEGRLREEFTRLRATNLFLAGADLSGAVLPSIDLGGADLKGAILSGADLRSAGLKQALLTEADLSLADLRRVTAAHAHFAGAQLNHVQAQGADFREAELGKADLSFGKFIETHFEGADIREARLKGAGFLRAVLPKDVELPTSAGPPSGDKIELRLDLTGPRDTNCVAWSPDGCCVAAGSNDGAVRVWDAATGRLLKHLGELHGAVFSIAWDPQSLRVACGSEQAVLVLRAGDGCLLSTLEGHSDLVSSVAWDPNGERLASASLDKTICLWNSDSGELLMKLEGHTGPVNCVAWDPSGCRLASASSDRTVRLWSTSDGRPLRSLEGAASGVYSVSWQPNGKGLAAGSHDDMVHLWSTDTGQLLNSLAHADSVEAVAWQPGGSVLATSTVDGTVTLWDPIQGRLLGTIEGQTTFSPSIAWEPSGRWLAVSERSVTLWNTDVPTLIRSFEAHPEELTSISWNPSGQRLATAVANAISLWNSGNTVDVRTPGGKTNSILTVRWSPSGGFLASGSSDGALHLWKSDEGRLIHVLEGHDKGVCSLAWRPDGGRLASGSYDATIHLWDPGDERLVLALKGHTNLVLSLAWEPVGVRLASASFDKTIRVWDSSNGKLLHTLEGHASMIRSVDWEPNGQRLASGAFDGTVRLWNANNGQLLQTLEGHADGVACVAWKPEGGYLASGSMDRTVQIWNSDTGAVVHSLKVGCTVQCLEWALRGQALMLGGSGGYIELWDLTSSPPCPVARLYHTPNGSGFAATMDGYVDGPPKGLEWVRFGENWALYDLSDVPERHSPERVRAALAPLWGE